MAEGHLTGDHYRRVAAARKPVFGIGTLAMAVTMVSVNRHELAASLFATGYTMASLRANECSESSDVVAAPGSGSASTRSSR